MRARTRLRAARAALLALSCVALLAVCGVRPLTHPRSHAHGSTSPTVVLAAYQDVLATAPAAIRVASDSAFARSHPGLGITAVTLAVADLVLLAWLLVALPWSGSALGDRGRLPGRRSPPLLLS